MDVGAELRQAREGRGLSLQQLASRTKISVTALRAIEDNDASRLPGGIFTRGFLKAYAREVDLDPADVARRYAEQFEPPPSPGNPVEQPAPSPAARQHGLRVHVGRLLGRLLERVSALGLVAALAVAAAFYVALVRWRNVPADAGRSEVTDGTATAMSGRSDRSSTAMAAVTATTGSSDTTAPLRIELQPTDQCWISATADGTRAAYRMMRAGERQAIEVRNELTLRVGEPANFRFSINGSPGLLHANPGVPVTVRITRENYLEFLAR